MEYLDPGRDPVYPGTGPLYNTSVYRGPGVGVLQVQYHYSSEYPYSCTGVCKLPSPGTGIYQLFLYKW